jgi:hypothetical protein
MKTKIITASSNISLNKMIQDMSAEGWEPIGSHSSVVVHSQNRYAGTQHMDTIHETEYSITMIKADPKMNMIKVDVAFYHPNDDETIRVYDEEGMREEFEYKLKEIMKYQE